MLLFWKTRSRASRIADCTAAKELADAALTLLPVTMLLA